MAKVSEEARKKYFEMIAPYKKGASEINDKEERVKKILRSDDPGASYKYLAMADDNLIQMSYYLVMNSLSVNLLGVKNEQALNDARKTCYKILIHLEKVFTNLVDVPYQDHKEFLEAISFYPEMDRYLIVRRVGLAIDRMIDGYGENSKWKWTFVELQARLAAIAKNCMNLKQFGAHMDPRYEGFKERVGYFNLTRRLLQNAADAYRKRYELSTYRMDDFRMAISYLGALKRLSLLLGRQQEASSITKKMGIWKSKMESDLKNKEAHRKKNGET